MSTNCLQSRSKSAERFASHSRFYSFVSSWWAYTSRNRQEFTETCRRIWMGLTLPSHGALTATMVPLPLHSPFPSLRRPSLRSSLCAFGNLLEPSECQSFTSFAKQSRGWSAARSRAVHCKTRTRLVIIHETTHRQLVPRAAERRVPTTAATKCHCNETDFVTVRCLENR